MKPGVAPAQADEVLMEPVDGPTGPGQLFWPGGKGGTDGVVASGAVLFLSLIHI